MIYKPLDEARNEIRVLRFLPPPGDLSSHSHAQETLSPLECILDTVSLDDYDENYVYLKQLGRDSKTSVFRNYIKNHWDPSLLLHENIEKVRARGRPSYDRWKWGEYACLSYTWEDGEPTHAVIINWQDFKVTKNLNDALHALKRRSDSRDLGFWIDAICINQQDYDERGSQVRRMDQIYESALRTIAWLGTATEDNTEAFRVIHELHGRWLSIEKENKGDRVRPSPSKVKERRILQDAHDLIGPQGEFLSLDSYKALATLLQRRYWSRLWTVQELGLGNVAVEIVCGNQACLFSHLVEIFRTLIPLMAVVEENIMEALRLTGRPSDQREVHRSLFRLLRFTWFFETWQKTLRLWQALDISRDNNCRDPRDKVYGILGLLDPIVSRGVVPAYRLSPYEVYFGFLKSTILASKSLDILHQHQNHPFTAREGVTWPSWVFDLTKSQIHHPFAKGVPFNAHGAKPASVNFSDQGLLVAQGFRIGTLDGLGCRCNPLGSTTVHTLIQPEQTYCIYAHDDASRSVSRTPSTTLIRTAIWDTLTAGRSEHGQYSSNKSDLLLSVPIPPQDSLPSEDLADPPPWLRAFGKFQHCNRALVVFSHPLESYFGTFSPTAPLEAWKNAADVMQRVVEVLQWRRLATLKEGFLGLVPRLAKQGDIVVILLGCSVPLVLRGSRKGERGTVEYKLIGSAYIHGIMEGEAVGAGLIRLKDFVLC